MRPEVGHAPSTRGRRRKNHAHAHSIDASSAARASLLRPAGVPGARMQKRPLFNAVFSAEHEDDIADALVDPLDVVTTLDLAAARYAQNHVYLERIFGPQRLDLMELPASPYHGKDAGALRDELARLEAELGAAQTAHAEHVQALTAPAPADAEAPADEPEWAQRPSAGRIVGVGFVPAPTPPAVAEMLRAEALRREEIARAPPDAALAEQTAAAIREIPSGANVH